MILAFFWFFVALVLVAGSTQVQTGWLEVAQFVLGVFFAAVGALAGWKAAREQE